MTGKEGERFSQNYLPKGEPHSDSSRMRRRIFRLFKAGELDEHVSAGWIEMELGVAIPGGVYSTRWEKFFTECELRDFLDVITIVTHALRSKRLQFEEIWIENVRAIFSEENIGYRLDDLGGVHFAIDQEFDHLQSSAITALNGRRYGAARAHYESGQKALNVVPPDTREAIRQTFEAAETLFKLLFPTVSTLGSSEVSKKLKPMLESALSGTERDSALRILESFKEWINSAQPYRHAQGVHLPDRPSSQFAVLSVSLGSSFVRWLAELDSQRQD